MSNSGRRRVRETRLYSPPPMRMYNQQPEFHQLQKQVRPHLPKQEKQDQSESFVNSNIRRNAAVMTNLDRFMKHTIPIVTAQHFLKIKTGDLLLVLYEAYLWDKLSWNVIQKKKKKKGNQGAYDEEESAARAYDLAALKYWGSSTFTNFPRDSDFHKPSTREFVSDACTCSGYLSGKSPSPRLDEFVDYVATIGNVKDELAPDGNDIYLASRSCALINQKCHVKNKDILKFLNGNFVSG
ncbi:hypothetical protein L6452_43804 [Arctium lappa]|uniref:Uncharacterized protein n=1 Tax=Arctium lappa TaxID=4217 RepID=A0ACB8XE53_ARCLA|nr:hypothetical protein L6452_43804 [Arctium lappa]